MDNNGIKSVFKIISTIIKIMMKIVTWWRIHKFQIKEKKIQKQLNLTLINYYSLNKIIYLFNNLFSHNNKKYPHSSFKKILIRRVNKDHKIMLSMNKVVR